MAIPFLRAQSTKVYTSLPTSPDDGQELRFLADATNGVIWNLRYRAASASTYKWEFIGGQRLRALNSGAHLNFSTTGVGTYAAVTNGPTLAVPLAGDYAFNLNSDAAIAATVLTDLRTTANTTAGTVSARPAAYVASVAGSLVTLNAVGRILGIAASGTIGQAAATNNTQGNWNQIGASLDVVPIRVG